MGPTAQALSQPGSGSARGQPSRRTAGAARPRGASKFLLRVDGAKNPWRSLPGSMESAGLRGRPDRQDLLARHLGERGHQRYSHASGSLVTLKQPVLLSAALPALPAWARCCMAVPSSRQGRTSNGSKPSVDFSSGSRQAADRAGAKSGRPHAGADVDRFLHAVLHTADSLPLSLHRPFFSTCRC